jgi:hypothetical protein
MPMVKMKSGKTMKFPYTKKGKAAAKKVAAKKMVHGGGVTKAKAGASIPAAGKSKSKTVKTKMATGGMVGKIRSSKVVGTEDEKENKKGMKGMKGMMGGGAMYGGKKKKGMMGRRSMKDGGQAEKDLKKGDMRQVRADMAKKKAAAMKDMKKDRNK